ncbi:MAG TPA: hypothetical protein VGO39_07535 [Gaiellaceae bacterium]|jgi:hypothetical protein|nr:hypothetical protein [Gaiellaceae bacterium]
MDSADHDLLLDDVVFEPNGWDFAVSIGIGIDPETDPPALDELADAMLVWAEGDQLERLTDEALERVWDAELEGLVREGIVRLSGCDGWEQGAAEVLAAFDRDPAGSEVAREVVRNLALQFGSADHPLFCLCCVEEQLVRAEPAERRGHAVRVAIVATRNAAVPAAETRAALADAARWPPAARLGTLERRAAIRARLGRLGGLATESMPELAVELKALAAEPLPERPEDDDVWEEACVHVLAEVGRPELN